MNSTSTISLLLDELRVNLNLDWPAELSDSESRLLMGLYQFEGYASVPVAAWLEGVFSENEFAELSGSDMVSHLRECADYVTSAMQLTDPVLRSGWDATSRLVSSLPDETDGRELARKAFVVFFAALALRSHVEPILGGKSNEKLCADNKRIANVFFDRARDRVRELELPVQVDISPTQFLASLDVNLQWTNWIQNRPARTVREAK